MQKYSKDHNKNDSFFCFRHSKSGFGVSEVWYLASYIVRSLWMHFANSLALIKLCRYKCCKEIKLPYESKLLITSNLINFVHLLSIRYLMPSYPMKL